MMPCQALLTEHVDAPEAGDGPLHGGLEAGESVQVEASRQEAVTGVGKRDGHLRRIARGGDHGVAAGKREADQFAAEALGGAGDKPDHCFGKRETDSAHMLSATDGNQMTAKPCDT